jgi:hypothetical protein
VGAGTQASAISHLLPTWGKAGDLFRSPSLSGFGWYVYRVFFVGTGFPPISSLFMTTAVVIFLIGLDSEQITYLRYGREQ